VRGWISDRVMQRAARTDELEEFSAKRLQLLGRPVYLVRLDANRYFALSAVCTHMNICQLEWNEDRRQLVCPCHGGAFDVYGNVVQGPPSIPLRTWPVEQLGEDIFIDRLG
jgi:Rieske Fe-S protein